MATRASTPPIVAVVGGATAGAEAAGLFAERGIRVVVFEQNARPYGKIEDGLPRWHVKLRRKEYETINERLSRPGVEFVPCTKIGRDIDFRELATAWGFSAIVLAHGAWRDRPLPVAGADAFVGRGLVYQNPFIYWFNHLHERTDDGARHEALDDAIVVGGGLASIDVLKVLQIETVRAALAARGVDEDMLEIEAEGVPAILARHDLTWDRLGLAGATLFYRRRIEDMPLAEMPDSADPAKQQKVEATRRKILEKAMQKYCFSVRPLHLPVGLVVEGDRLVGLRFQRTRVENGRAVPIPGEPVAVRGSMVVSSIGSIPEPMAGVPQDDGLYRLSDAEVGRLAGYDAVFCIGNVVTGKGNIAVSRKHSARITAHVIESFLGIGNGRHEGEERLLDGVAAGAAAAAEEVAKVVAGRPPLEPARADALLARVRERQTAVGYPGSYREWIAKVTPPDFV